MTTFIGEYNCKVDSKGRIVLPSSFKKQMESNSQGIFVVKKDLFETCLVMYPIEEWTRQTEIIRKKLNPYNREHNILLRGLYKGMDELRLDNMNRLLLPKKLLSIVEIVSDVVMLGQDEKIEIWSSEKYSALDDGKDDFAALAERILGSSHLSE
jgi:MraZ protein